MLKELCSIFDVSFKSFVKRDITNILANVSERTLCGNLSYQLQNELQKTDYRNYFVDVEYNRKQDGEIKTIINQQFEVIKINCDLIVHSRGASILNDNLICIEMKKTGRPKQELIDDRNRLIALTKINFSDVWSNDGHTHPEHVCGYKLGLYIIMDLKNKCFDIEYYVEGKLVKTRKVEF